MFSFRDYFAFITCKYASKFDFPPAILFILYNIESNNIESRIFRGQFLIFKLLVVDFCDSVPNTFPTATKASLHILQALAAILQSQ